jgi:hypothetical protein
MGYDKGVKNQRAGSRIADSVIRAVSGDHLVSVYDHTKPLHLKNTAGRILRHCLQKIYYQKMKMNHILGRIRRAGYGRRIRQKEEEASRRGKAAYRVLMGIAAALALLLLAGTLYALVFRPARAI